MGVSRKDRELASRGLEAGRESLELHDLSPHHTHRESLIGSFGRSTVDASSSVLIPRDDRR